MSKKFNIKTIDFFVSYTSITGKDYVEKHSFPKDTHNKEEVKKHLQDMYKNHSNVKITSN